MEISGSLFPSARGSGLRLKLGGGLALAVRTKGKRIAEAASPTRATVPAMIRQYVRMLGIAYAVELDSELRQRVRIVNTHVVHFGTRFCRLRCHLQAAVQGMTALQMALGMGIWALYR